MAAVSNPSIEKFDDYRPQSNDLPAQATENIEFLFDWLVREIGEPSNDSPEVCTFVVPSNPTLQQTEEDVVDAFAIVGEAAAASVSSDRIELLELLEPDRTDAQTAQAMEGLLEFLAIEGRAQSLGSSAHPSEVVRLEQLNTQMSQRLLQLEERSDLCSVRQLNAELSEKVNQLEERLRVADRQLTQLLPQVSQLLTRQATEIAAKEKSKKRCFSLVVAVWVVLAGMSVWTLSRGLRVASEVERAIAMLNQINGMALSATVDRGNVTLRGIAHPAANLEQIDRTFGQIPGVKTVTNTIDKASPAMATRVYFQVNSATVVDRDIDGKLRSIKQAMQQSPKLQLKIIGHAHWAERSNKQSNLALERSRAVQTLLEDLGVPRRRTQALSRPGSPPDVAPNQEGWLSQCVLFETSYSTD